MKKEILRRLKELKVVISKEDAIDILNAYIKDTIITKNPSLSSKDNRYINITEEFVGESLSEIIIVFLNKEVEYKCKKEHQSENHKLLIEILERAINYYLNNETKCLKTRILLNSRSYICGFRFYIPMNVIQSISTLDNILIKALKKHANVELDIDVLVLDELLKQYIAGEVSNCFATAEDTNYMSETLEMALVSYLGDDAIFNLYQLSNITLAKFFDISRNSIETTDITREAVSISLPFEIFSNIFLLRNN